MRRNGSDQRAYPQKSEPDRGAGRVRELGAGENDFAEFVGRIAGHRCELQRRTVLLGTTAAMWTRDDLLSAKSLGGAQVGSNETAWVPRSALIATDKEVISLVLARPEVHAAGKLDAMVICYVL